ncbi:MAG: hypothetical protein IJX99_08665 [Clostridia bacterium]|nr:hypothetical protein [Clostridia bacterium]
MDEIVNLIFNYGGTVILAGLFIYVFFTDRKDNMQVLKELSSSNHNIAESLNLLKTSINNNTAEYRQHDERAIKQFSSINEHLIRIEDKIDKRGE